VLGDSIQRLDVSLDEFGGAMVVIEDGADAVVEGVVDLADPHVDAEDDVDDVVQEEVEEMAHGGSHPLAVVEARPIVRFGVGLGRGRDGVVGEVGSEELLAFVGR
jgi:hypothetical protein